MRNGSRRIKKLQALSVDATVDLWAMDEVHFQQHGSRCRMWVPPEIKDPVLLHHPTRKSVGYFGAVRLRDGKFFFRRETGKFNAVTCWQFLKDLGAVSTRTPRRAVVIADNAKYHHARLHRDWRQERAERFALDFLPPYSPELNPVERVWKLTRRLCLHNRYFSKLDDVAVAVETEFTNWKKSNDTLRRLCAIT
jgi:DDE superfamily endonuclease